MVEQQYNTMVTTTNSDWVFQITLIKPISMNISISKFEIIFFFYYLNGVLQYNEREQSDERKLIMYRKQEHCFSTVQPLS